MSVPASPEAQPLPPASSTARRVIVALSATVVVAVGVVLYLAPRRLVSPEGGPDTLATVNALLNAGAAISLSLGYVFIRRRRVAIHRACMLAAFGFSSVFLVTYLVHHARVGSVAFRGVGWTRAVYFAILVPHVLLAALIVPLALETLRRAWTGDFARHRPLARRTLPLWLYVSVSGVALYWMLYR